MNARYGLYALLLMTVSPAVWACDLPTLVAIPADGRLGENSAQLFVGVQRYVTGIRVYAACVLAELEAAGGESAPEMLRNQLIDRNNRAVAEARAVLAIFGERVAPQEDLYLAEFVAGGGEECIRTDDVNSVGVLNDVAVFFGTRDGSAYLNVLEASCADLERYGTFQVRQVVGPTNLGLRMIQSERVCSSEFIQPYLAESTAQLNRECGLGLFFELTPEQRDRLMAAREATRPAVTEPAASGGPAAGTPERRRSER
jgi:hypothetical protein